jgi:hypothetical protein
MMSWLMPLVVLLEWRPLRIVAFFPGVYRLATWRPRRAAVAV